MLDLEGNIPIISTSEEINHSNMNGTKGKIIAIGSSSILSNKFLSKNTGNHLLGKNIVYWINENPKMLEIDPREVDTLPISMKKKILITYFIQLQLYQYLLHLLEFLLVG